MARFPDIAYRFAVPKDTSGPTLELFTRVQVFADTDNDFTIDFNGVSKDRAVILTNLTADLAPGATQGVLRFVASFTTPSMLSCILTEEIYPGTADVRAAHVWTGEVMIGGGGR